MLSLLCFSLSPSLYALPRRTVMGKLTCKKTVTMHVWMWALHNKQGWALKNWWFRTAEKTLENPLDCKEIKPVNPKGDQPWIFIRRTGAKAPILWLLDSKSWLIGKDTDAGKDGGQKENRLTEDEMVGWPHWLNGHESEQTLGDIGGRRNLVCCSPWGQSLTPLSYWMTTTNYSVSFYLLLTAIT